MGLKPALFRHLVGYHRKQGVARGAGLGVCEAPANVVEVSGLLQVGGHQVQVTPVGGVPPDAYRLGGKHPVGEGDDEDAPRFEDAVHLPEHLNWAGQVLD